MALTLLGCSTESVGGPTPTEPLESSTPSGAASPAASGAAPTGSAAATPTAAATPAPSPACAEPGGCFGAPERVGVFDAALVPEASGLAASRRAPGLWYLLDDGPGTSRVWVLGADAALLGAVEVAGLDGTDTEDLAVGACGPGEDTSCVYVADTGDNLRARPSVAVVRFAEPDLAAGLPAGPVPADAITLHLPAGPEDAEALLVDGDGTPHLVTKARFDRGTGETAAARLLAAPGFADGVLADVGEVPVPAPAVPLVADAVGNVVTGGDALLDGRPGRVLLRTYDQILLYTAPSPDSPLSTLPEWSVRAVPTPFLPQSEAVAWAADGCGYATASEGIGDLWHVPCR